MGYRQLAAAERGQPVPRRSSRWMTHSWVLSLKHTYTGAALKELSTLQLYTYKYVCVVKTITEEQEVMNFRRSGTQEEL